MIYIRDIQISPEEVKDIVSCDISRRLGYLLHVHYYPPLADVVFLFKTKKERDGIFNNIQREVSQ